MLPERIALALGAVVLGATLAPGLASAGSGGHDAVQVRVTGPPGCASTRAFLANLRRRLPGYSVAAGGKAAVRATLAREGQKVIGRLRIDVEGGGSVHREITANGCGEALDALAFIAAVALDPRSEAPVQPRRPPPPEGPPPATPPLQTPPSARSEKATVPPPPPSPPVRWTLGVGAFGGVRSGLAPDVAAGAGAELSLGVRLTRWFGLEGHLHGAHHRAGSPSTDLGRAAFALTTGGVDLCAVGVVGAPSRTQPGRLALGLCAAGAGGQFVAQGRSTFDPEVVERPWGEVGGGLRVAVPLTPWLALRARGALVFPVIPGTFALDDIVLHRIPDAAASTDFGVTVRLW